MLCRVPLVCKCVRYCVCVSLLAQGQVKSVSLFETLQPLSDRTMKWAQTPPAVSARLAVWLTDDTDSLTPSRSEAVYHSLNFFLIHVQQQSHLKSLNGLPLDLWATFPPSATIQFVSQIVRATKMVSSFSLFGMRLLGQQTGWSSTHCCPLTGSWTWSIMMNEIFAHPTVAQSSWQNI